MQVRLATLYIISDSCDIMAIPPLTVQNNGTVTGFVTWQSHATAAFGSWSALVFAVVTAALTVFSPPRDKFRPVVHFEANNNSSLAASSSEATVVPVTRTLFTAIAARARRHTADLCISNKGEL